MDNDNKKKEWFVKNCNMDAYISWIEKYCKENEVVRTDRTSKMEDQLYVKQIEFLYKIVDEVATKFYFTSFDTIDGGNYYIINLNNKSYIIGVDNEKQQFYYCNPTTIEEGFKPFEITDIMYQAKVIYDPTSIVYEEKTGISR